MTKPPIVPNNFGVKILNKSIKNKASYPEAEWLDTPKQIGAVAAEPLYLLGYEYPASLVENPKNYPIVAIDRVGSDELFADTLGELLTNVREQIEITEDV